MHFVYVLSLLIYIEASIASQFAATPTPPSDSPASRDHHDEKHPNENFRERLGASVSNLGSKIPKIQVDETVDSEEEDLMELHRKGRWTFVDEDPIVSVIKSVKDLFPRLRVTCEPTTTLKLRKVFRPLKTIVTLGADYNTNIGVWRFRSSWEDSIIGGRISIAGREVMLSKSWMVKLMESEELVTRLKLNASVDTRDWKAYAKFGLRTERIVPLNMRDGFTVCRKFPLDGSRGHAKLEVLAKISLPEPEIRFSTEGDNSQGVVAGMGDIHVGVDELNLLLQY